MNRRKDWKVRSYYKIVVSHLYICLSGGRCYSLVAHPVHTGPTRRELRTALVQGRHAGYWPGSRTEIGATIRFVILRSNMASWNPLRFHEIRHWGFLSQPSSITAIPNLTQISRSTDGNLDRGRFFSASHCFFTWVSMLSALKPLLCFALEIHALHPQTSAPSNERRKASISGNLVA